MLMSGRRSSALTLYTMYDPNDYSDQLHTEAVSPNRPPQFNESTCGYRCGWGCCEPDGGGDGGSDATPTLVGSEDEADTEATEGSALHAGVDASRPTGSHNNRDADIDAAPVVLVDDSQESLQLSQHVLAHGDPIAPCQLNRDHDESVKSLENQADSEPRSSAASDQRSTGSASPYGWDTGIGGWADDSNANRLPGYFCVTPLRLSAQLEHCRGTFASHTMMRDCSMLLDIAGEDWGVHMSVDDWAMYPRLGFPSR
jgi:hypothetical protein